MASKTYVKHFEGICPETQEEAEIEVSFMKPPPNLTGKDLVTGFVCLNKQYNGCPYNVEGKRICPLITDNE